MVVLQGDGVKRSTRHLTLALAAIISLGSVLVIPADEAAAAIVPVELPPGIEVTNLTSVADIAVSPDLVFLAEGSTGGDVAVMDHDGTQVGTIRNVPGPIALATRGDTLYVAARGASAIYVYDISVDPATLVDTYSTLPVSQPTSLARAGGRLWFTGIDHGNSSTYASLGSMTTAGEDIASYLPPTFEDWQLPATCGAIDHSSFAPSRLFLRERGCYTGSYHLHVYDASSEPPVRLTEFGSASGAGYDRTMVAVLPSGTETIFQSSERDALDVRSLDSLSGPTGGYFPPDRWTVTGEATVTGGTSSIASTAYRNGWDGDQGLLTWDVGTEEPTNAFLFDPVDGAVKSTLAFDATASRLFAATTNGAHIAFHVIDPTLKGTSLELTLSDRSVVYGQPLRVRAQLAGPTGGRDVTIRKTVNGTTSILGSCTTDAAGRCNIVTRPTGPTTYQAAFEGGDGWAASTSTLQRVRVAVDIRGELRRYYARSDGYALYHEDQRVVYAIEVDPPRPNRIVGITVQGNGGSGWTLLLEDTFRLDDRGKVTLYFRPGSFARARYRILARYGGDDEYDKNTTRFAYFRVTQ